MDFMTYYKQLKNKEISNINLITGQEIYYIDHTVKMIESSFLNPTYKDLNFTTFEGPLDVDQFIGLSDTMPFFDEKRIVFANNTNIFKIAKEDQETKLLQFLKDVPDHLIILFVERDIDKRKKIFKQIEKQGTFVEVGKLSHSELIKWVSKKFKEYKTEINNHALNYFVEMSNYLDKESSKNLYDIENVIKSLSSTSEEITESRINQYMEIPIEHNIFKMIDAISERNLQTSLLILNEILNKGEPEIKVFYLISQQFRNILKVKYLVKNGFSSNIVATKIGIHPFVAKKASHFANQYSFESLHEIINIIEQVDIEMKSTGLSPRFLVEKALFQINSKS